MNKTIILFIGEIGSYTELWFITSVQAIKLNCMAFKRKSTIKNNSKYIRESDSLIFVLSISPGKHQEVFISSLPARQIRNFSN